MGTGSGRVIDLRSDTVTLPTEEMREAMRSAPLGDDVFGEDPTVNRLEEMAAAKLGKEAALLVPSGIMGNQVALLTHTRRGDEVVLEADAHIVHYESGAPAVLSGVMLRPLPGEHGLLAPEQIEAAVRTPDIHTPPTTLICLENTHNLGGGSVYPLAALQAIAALARARGIPVHLDGARIFNAAAATGVPASAIAACADSVMFCLSKGLAAPVGSLLCGPAEFIARARRFRRMVGGAMRKAGVLAAAGIVALEKMVDRLEVDHANAKRLAAGLAKIPGVLLDAGRVQTNIIIFRLAPPQAAVPLVRALAAEGVKALPVGPAAIRMVTHKDVGAADMDVAVAAVARHLSTGRTA
ncbi:MAG: aminotransferase class I/II-fold pyridoxal phosphate-dependent enzyme [candidate division NC10 bacterium]|nr:aminotransferase class I/II-fold pyridoxal phosphate-dependent enzyme [candidate division NC10 bacterium]